MLLGFECTMNTQNLNKIVRAIFERIEINFFFLWITLNFEGWSKTKKPPTNICKRILDKGFERDWSVGLGDILGDGHTENLKKYIFF